MGLGRIRPHRVEEERSRPPSCSCPVPSAEGIGHDWLPGAQHRVCGCSVEIQSLQHLSKLALQSPLELKPNNRGQQPPAETDASWPGRVTAARTPGQSTHRPCLPQVSISSPVAELASNAATCWTVVLGVQVAGPGTMRLPCPVRVRGPKLPPTERPDSFRAVERSP